MMNLLDLTHLGSSLQLVEDRRKNLASLTEPLTEMGIQVYTARSLRQARIILKTEVMDVVVCKTQFLNASFNAFIQEVMRRNTRTWTVLLSEWEDLEVVIEAIRRVFAQAESPPAIKSETAETSRNLLEKELGKYQIRNRMKEYLEDHFPGLTQVEFDEKGFLMLHH